MLEFNNPVNQRKVSGLEIFDSFCYHLESPIGKTSTDKPDKQATVDGRNGMYKTL